MSDARKDAPDPRRQDVAATGPGDGAAPRNGWVGWLEQRMNLTEVFSFLTHFGLVYWPVDTSRPVRDVVRELATQPVPTHSRGPRVLGLLTTILFGLEALTGVLLAYYYRPTPEAAFESTRTIVRDLPSGWFIHQMHAWGAWLLVGIVMLRLFRLLWDGLYRAPREVLWWSAVALMWIVLQLDFTGRLLIWDTHSYWAAVRGMEVVWAIPVAGPILAFLLGGHVVNEDVLIRFYVLHLLVLPAFYLAFVYVTFATLRRVGLSPTPSVAPAATTTFRRHIYSMLIFAVLLFATLVTLATLLPFRFVGAADPYATPVGVRPPWYMLAPYALLQLAPVPMWVSGGLLLLAAFAVLLLPAWARERGPFTPGRVRIAGLVVLGLWIVLSVVGFWIDRR